MTFRVDWTTRALDDLDRLVDFIVECELLRSDGDMSLPERAVTAVKEAITMLERSPFACRRAGGGSTLRELVVSFGATGYVVLFDATAEDRVIVSAIRHQREHDYKGG